MGDEQEPVRTTSEKPLSLHPLNLEEALRGLLATLPVRKKTAKKAKKAKKAPEGDN